MNRHFDPHFKKDIITLHPGEYCSSSEDVYLATVLGSCISVALFDPEISLGGLNHFMLSKHSSYESPTQEDEGRFGDFAMELLINDLMKKGASRKNLRAKVFGGSNVLEDGGYHMNMTGINNINFAVNFLNTENIPIVVNDTGGILPRKIYFHPQTAKVYLKRIQKASMTMEELKKREEEYQRSLDKIKENMGDITWF